MTRYIVEPPSGEGATPPDRPDVFVSYSRKDADFVARLVSALEAHSVAVWVDLEDIPKSADWRAKIEAGIECAKTVVSVLSPDFAASKVCSDETTYAVAQHKRLIPLVCRDLDGTGLHPELNARNWIFFRDDQTFDESLVELTSAIAADLDWLDEHARYNVRALEWQRAERDGSLLLNGTDLRAAEDWLSRPSPEHVTATSLQAEYIVASRRRAARRQRLTLSSVAAALVVSTALAVVALLLRGQAVTREKVARSRELAATATAQLPIDPERSVLLARYAIEHVRRTTEAQDALRTALSKTYQSRVLAGVGLMTDAEFSPDDRLVAGTSAKGLGLVWRASDGKLVASVGRHADVTWTVRFVRDGRGILLSSWDGTASFWNIQSGEGATMGVEGERLNDAEATADASKAVTAGFDHLARIFDASHPEGLALRGHNGAVSNALFSPDRRHVLTGSLDGTVRVWNADTGATERVLRAGTPVLKVCQSPDGAMIAAAGSDGTARLWSSTDGRLLHILRGHRDIVLDVEFSRDGTRIVSSSLDGTARVWAVATGATIAELRGHTDVIRTARFSPDGMRVVTASADGTARVWDARTGETIAELRGQPGILLSASFSHDGRRVLTSSSAGTARIWRVTPSPPIVLGRPHAASAVAGVVYSPDGKLALAATGKVVRVWSTTTGRRRFLLGGHTAAVNWVSFSPNGARMLGASTDDRTTRVWSTRTGRLIRVLRSRPDELNGAVFTPDGRYVVTGREYGAELWDLETGRVARRFRGSDLNIIQAVAISPDGKRIAAGGGASVDNGVLWDTQSGKAVAMLRGHSDQVVGIAFSPDGKRLATASWDGTARVWDSRDGDLRAVLRGHANQVYRAVFSPDSRLVATASRDQTARVFDARTGRKIAQLRGSGNDVTEVVFNPASTLVATASSDRTARIWEASTGEPVAVYRLPDEVTSVAFSPSGMSLLVGARDGTVRVYRCELCGSLRQLLAIASARVRRQLTNDEKQTFLP